ncbi:MAG: nucleoside-triphosphatase [Halobacteria archaeon]|nr:nucleoside-triphosphatase [Halobacteria archaeon]
MEETTNFAVTGPPKSGKTTAVERVVRRLSERGFEASGVVSPEIRREDGEKRVGFGIVDVATRDSRTMAHVGFDDGPQVGKYTVDTSAVEEVCATALDADRAEDDGGADYFVVDEVAPMQTATEVFVTRVLQLLESEVPVVLAVKRSGSELGDSIKSREDTSVFEVENRRDETVEEIERSLVEALSPRG